MTGINLLAEYGITPTSFAFPRNRIGNRDVLADAGIEVYRGRDDVWFERWDIPNLSRKPFRFLNEAVSWTPPAVEPRPRGGLVEIPGSQVFRPLHDGWEYTPERTQVARAKKGLNKAVESGRIFHLRFHPFDLGFKPERLLARLEEILRYASRLRDDGELEFATLTQLARDPTRMHPSGAH
jgi:hypothetical protein